MVEVCFYSRILVLSPSSPERRDRCEEGLASCHSEKRSDEESLFLACRHASIKFPRFSRDDLAYTVTLGLRITALSAITSSRRFCCYTAPPCESFSRCWRLHFSRLLLPRRRSRSIRIGSFFLIRMQSSRCRP